MRTPLLPVRACVRVVVLRPHLDVVIEEDHGDLFAVATSDRGVGGHVGMLPWLRPGGQRFALKASTIVSRHRTFSSHCSQLRLCGDAR